MGMMLVMSSCADRMDGWGAGKAGGMGDGRIGRMDGWGAGETGGMGEDRIGRMDG